MLVEDCETRALLVKVIECLEDVVADAEERGLAVRLPDWETLRAEVAAVPTSRSCYGPFLPGREGRCPCGYDDGGKVCPAACRIRPEIQRL